MEKVSKRTYIKECIDLFLSFLKIGFIAFGGGLAILKVFENEFVTKKKLLTHEELYDYYVLSQLIPGVIIVSSSAFIGYRLKKQPGIFISLLGVIIPSITVISIIALCLNSLIAYPIVSSILRGMNVAVCAILIDINIDMIKKNVTNFIYFIIFISAFITMRFFNVSILFIVLGAFIIGLFYKEKTMKDEIIKVKDGDIDD
ncbi:MAG: chromate transporter [Clostridia bacterium]|nr:chromate transporter [Clostridia bacterium]